MEAFADRKVYTVSQLTSEIRSLLEVSFPDIWVRGEISNFRVPPSGHFYFTLKDEHAQLKAVCFKPRNLRLRFRPEDGLEVIVRGRLTAYEPRGDYQIIVEHMEPVGVGSLQLAFEQLKEKLRKEGLFDSARKKPLPLLPRRIGIVTSPTGAAIRDILRILERRNRNLSILIYPTRVQGDGAAEEIASGIRYLNTLGDIDVIIAGRGGGSIEDLWAFNEEVVARAIYDSRIPVISAVGHEIDFTIADFVADLRAPTPSAAAELVSGARDELKLRVDSCFARLRKAIVYMIEKKRRRFDLLRRSRAFDQVPVRIREALQRVDDHFYRLSVSLKALVVARRNNFSSLSGRLARVDLRRMLESRRQSVAHQLERMTGAVDASLKRSRSAFQMYVGKLHALSPLAVLDRGYAICRRGDGAILKQASAVWPGELIEVTLAEGKLDCEVKRVKG